MGSALNPFLNDLEAYQTTLGKHWDPFDKAGDVKKVLEGSQQVSFDTESDHGSIEPPCESFGSTVSTRAPSSFSPCPSTGSVASFGSNDTVALSALFDSSDDPDAFSQFLALVELERQLLDDGGIPHHIHEKLNKKIHETFIQAIGEIEDNTPPWNENTERTDEEKKKRNLLYFVLFASVACVTETVGAFGDVYELIAHLGLHGIALKIAVAATFALIYQTVLWAFDLHAVAEDLGVSYFNAPAHLEMLCEQARRMYSLQKRISDQLTDFPNDSRIKDAFSKAKALQKAFIDRSKRYQSLQEPSENKQRIQQFVKYAWIAVAIPAFAGGGFWEVYTTLHLSFMLPIIAAWPPGLALGLCIVGALAAVGIFYALQQKEMTNAVNAFFGSSKEHKDEYKDNIRQAERYCSANENRLNERSEATALRGEVAQWAARAQAAEASEVQLKAKNKALRRQKGSLHARLRGAKESLGLFSRKSKGAFSNVGSGPSPQMTC